MSTKYLYKVNSLDDIRNLPGDAGIGVLNGIPFVRSDAGLFPLALTAPATQYYVDPQNGDDANDGRSWGSAFASFDALDDILDDGDTIYFSGVYKGNWDAPYKNDVSLIGVANTPRQATDGGVANGAGATWLSVDTPVAAPLLTINKQAWRVENIFFNNQATANPCILLLRDAETPEADASHAAIIGCKFTGADDGIQQSGGVSFVKILGNAFKDFAGAGDIAISSVTGAGVGSFIEWEIAYNTFHGNVHNIIAAMGAASRIHHNFFVKIGNTITSTSIINLTGGNHVTVDQNVFGHASVEAPNDTLYVDGTACLWIANQCSNEVRYLKPDEA